MTKKTTAKRNTKKTKVLENGLVLREEDMTILWLSAEKKMENPEYLEIPEGVLAIEEEAFRRNHSLKRVILPKSLKHIGSNAFYDCIELKEISIPEGVEVLEDGAFAYCRNLTRIELHDGLKIISDNVLQGTGVEKLELPASVRVLGNNALTPVRYLKLNGEMPHNLMRAIAPMDWSTYWMYSDDSTKAMTVELEFPDKKLYLPKFINESESGLCECALNSGKHNMENSTFAYGSSGGASYDTAIKTYFYLAETGEEIPERLIQYTRRVAKRIVEYLIERKRTEDAVKFIKLNLLTPNAMESLYSLAVDLKRADIAAYLMEAINARGKKTSMRL